jgi:hypothetical protein
MSSAANIDTSNTLHKIFTNDPILFKSYVNKKVTIITEDSNVHTGFVYTVDPVSERLGFRSLYSFLLYIIIE